MLVVALGLALAQTGCVGLASPASFRTSSTSNAKPTKPVKPTSTASAVGAQQPSSLPATVVTPGQGQLSLNQGNVTFGNVTVGGNGATSVAVSNSGNVNVTISNISVSGSGFAAGGVSAGTTLAPGQSATLNLAFSPSTTGGSTGAVVISSDATDSVATVDLSGTGVQATSHWVGLAWSPGEASIIGYNIYRATVTGLYTKLTAVENATDSFTDSTVQAGQTYYYVVTEIDSSDVESAYSAAAVVTIPTP